MIEEGFEPPAHRSGIGRSDQAELLDQENRSVPAGTRTLGLRLAKAVLCQLSYEHKNIAGNPRDRRGRIRTAESLVYQTSALPNLATHL